jgi:hypothetical protein
MATMTIGRTAWLGILICIAGEGTGTAAPGELQIAEPQSGEAKAFHTVPPQEAIARAESLEKNYRVLRWKAHSVEMELDNAADSRSVAKQRKDYQDTQIVFDPVERRYNMTIQGVSSLGGQPPFVASIAGCSFDGEVYRDWRRTKLGGQLPAAEDDLPAQGGISKDRTVLSRLEDPVTLACVATGLGYMPPYVWDGESPCQPLSSLLRTWLAAKRDFSITEDYRGVWTIHATVNLAGNNGYRFQMRYDPKRGGVATGARWNLGAVAGSEIECARLEVELQQTTEETWMPKCIRRVLAFETPATMTQTTIDAVEVNPPTDADAFRVVFPKGARVTDHLQGKSFVAGEGEE